MPHRAHNRVGVEVDSRLQKDEEEPHGNSSRDSSIDGESSPTARGMRSVASAHSLEDAKTQRQKELLQKKKAERRAHAKQRAAEKQQRQDEKKQKRELLEMLDEDIPAPEPTKVPVCFGHEHEVKRIDTIEQAGSNRDSVPVLKTQHSQEEIEESSRKSLTAIRSDEGILQPTAEHTGTQRFQDSDYPSTTEIVPKKVQTYSQSAKSANAAALTIQKALKKKYKECTTMFRQSPRVFAEEVVAPSYSNSAKVVEPRQTRDKALEVANVDSKTKMAAPVHGPPVESILCIVPPLQLPQPAPSTPPPRPQSSASSSSAASCSSSCSCSDSGSFSSCSSCSCSCSSSSLSSPSVSETDTSSRNRRHSSHRSRSARFSESRRRKSRHHSARSSRRHFHDSSGPSSFLLPGGEHQQQASREEKKKYGEVHHFMATRIQTMVRGYRGRARARQRQAELDQELRDEALQELQQEACLKIQSRARGVLVRKKMPISDTERRRRRRRRSKVDNNHATAPLAEEDRSVETGIYADPDEIDEWPQEIDLELLDDWQGLNQLATTLEDSVTQSQFLSQGRLRVFCGTWNMHAKKPTDDLRLWIRLNKYHIVAVGSEECVNSIAKSVVFTSKKSWEDQLRGTLGEDYVLVTSHALTAIHNIVFVHTSILPLLGSIQSDAVATGLGNQLGNKGGVGISFTVGTTSFAFINSHFDAHQRNVSKRNGNFHRINHELRLSPSGSISSPTSSVAVAPTPGSTNTENLQGLGRTSANRFSMPGGAAAGSKRTVSERFDRVFWYGDLNYRINGTRRMVDTLLLRNQYEVLYANDQLQREMRAGNVFARFREGQLHFRPTYKFDKRSDVYDSSSKQRIPSWTDRVLYLSNDKMHDIELLSYRSQTDFRTSDHRPVCAIFQVNFSATGAVGLLQSPRQSSTSHENGHRDNNVTSQTCTVQ